MATLTQLQTWRADIDAGVSVLGARIASETAVAAALVAARASPVEIALKARRINHLGRLLNLEQARSRFLAGGVAAALGSVDHPALHLAAPTSSVEVPGFKTRPTDPGRSVSR